MVTIIGPRDRYSGPYKPINCTSQANCWSAELSPFKLGPVNLYDGFVSENVENAWQFSKVYEQFTNKAGQPTRQYFDWAVKGWRDSYAHRYPMGKGAKPLYSLWDDERLTYIEARWKIYIPLYAQAVVGTPAFKNLRKLYTSRGEIVLWDFDGYDHRKSGMDYDDVINCETLKMGHTFVLGMLLEGFLPFPSDKDD